MGVINKKSKSRFGSIFGLALFATTVSLSLSLIANSKKASATSIKISTGNDPILEVNLSSDVVNLNLTPSPNAPVFSTTDLTVTAGTNNFTGYQLFMEINDQNLSRTEPLANGTTPAISSLATSENGYTEDTFTTNSWGYKITGDNFLPIPTGEQLLSSSTEPVNQNSTTITFASKIDFNQPSGAYTTNIVLHAIANPEIILQDIDAWKGSLAVNDSVKAKDNRDGKYYTVSRLADNRIWFLDNLELDLTNPTVQANLSPSTTNATATSIDALLHGGRANGDNYANTGVSNWTSGKSFSAPLINLASKNVIPDNPPVDGKGANRVGGYYNFCSASAGSYCYGNGTESGTSTGNAIEDICPAGWRLPTGDTTGEYSALANAIYGSTGYNTDYRNVLSLPLSGYFDGESISSQGSYGVLWSSTRSDNGGMYSLRSTYGEISPASVDYRLYGYSVRCVAKLPDAVITFNANGGTGTMASQTLPDYGGTLTANTFTRDGYVFAGWNTKADGSGTSYSNGATYTGPSTTLYAQWQQQVIITFNANGGTGTMNPQTINGSTGTLNSNTFTRDGYAFNGWNTKADGSGTSYSNGATYTGPSTTLYAQWRALNITELTYMQDFASLSTDVLSGVKNSMVLDQAYQLKDSRDNKTYDITRLSVGNKIWMITNLNIAGGTTLTPATSNIMTNYTLPNSSTSGFSTANVAYVYNGTYGGYYSWGAATIGTATGSDYNDQDICPKGWRLPYWSEFDELIATYNTGAKLVTSPWRAVYSGMCLSNGCPDDVGSRGDWWAQDKQDVDCAVGLYITSSITDTDSDCYDTKQGLSVRCVAK